MADERGPIIRLQIIPGPVHKPKWSRIDLERFSITDFFLRIGTADGLAYGLFGPAVTEEMDNARPEA